MLNELSSNKEQVIERLEYVRHACECNKWYEKFKKVKFVEQNEEIEVDGMVDCDWRQGDKMSS